MNIIICGGSLPRILEFPGFEHCATIENFLYEEECPPNALIIGNTPEVFETAFLIASYNGDVTIMVSWIRLIKFLIELKNSILFLLHLVIYLKISYNLIFLNLIWVIITYSIWFRTNVPIGYQSTIKIPWTKYYLASRTWEYNFSKFLGLFISEKQKQVTR